MEKELFNKIKSNERAEILFLKKLIKEHSIEKRTLRSILKANSILSGISVSCFNNYYFVWKSLSLISEDGVYSYIDEEFYNWVCEND
jgi:hypothetical protein